MKTIKLNNHNSNLKLGIYKDSIPYQNGLSLKHTVQSVFVDDIDTTQTGMNAQLNLHEQLLKHNFGTHTNQAKPVVDLVYRRMQQTIAMGMKHNLIQQTTTSSQINKLISVQDTLLNRTSINDTINRYILIKDKALAMRLSNRRTTALTLLNQAHALADSSNKKFIEKWQCFIEKEILLKDSVINIKQFLALVKQCGVSDTTTSFGKQSDIEKSVTNNQTLSDALSMREIILYPNPTYDNLNVSIINLEGETQINIQIIDIVGRVIQTGSYQANDKNAILNIPLNLKSGTYFIKLDGGQIHVTKRFVVMK